MELRTTTVVTSAPQPAAPPRAGIVSFALRFTGYLYAVGLQDAFADLVARHEPLRTVHPVVNSAATRLVLGADAAPTVHLVPILTPGRDLPVLVADFLDEIRLAPMPVHARTFRIVDTVDDVPEHLLIVGLSRRAADRLSPARLSRDLITAYAARRRNRPTRWDTPRPATLHVHELRRVQLLEPALATIG
ncbi:hypothetical protein [Nocardia terpenica]|uniref:Condensation domain-containing protein n=1 Tax=Nocardia terpenica TaxID=455432 RepID=A0A6G9YZI6_9NOCA|nr:hypothetical protein [Nocardia terpenica]QIS18590.1 hypothetical protein F6W96_10065 [Nocardia terpenica]